MNKSKYQEQRLIFFSAFLLLFMLPPLWGQTTPAHKCGFAEHSISVNRVTTVLTRDVPDLDESYISPDGYFKIHYTKSGTNAVTGDEVMGTPVFVMEAAIAADSAYSVLVGDLGFLPPLPDDNFDGPELDIYIKEWAGSFYGMTYFGNSAPSATYLVIDNDYAESAYATSGLAALRVTVAHEFFHMVQLRYAYPFDPVSSNAYWYEISAVWMEELCYPEVNDYHAYVNNNFRQTIFPNLNDASLWFTYSYGHGLFGQLLDLEYGQQAGKHIMLDIWESLPSQEATDNLEQVLSSAPWNSSLTEALGRYALYNVFTGNRAINGMYYPDAAELDEIRTKPYDYPVSLPTDTVFTLAPLGISFRQFNPSETGELYVSTQNLTSKQRIHLTKHSPVTGSAYKGVIGNDIWATTDYLNDQDYLIVPAVNGDRDSSHVFSLYFQGNTFQLEDAIQNLWPNPTSPNNGSLHLSLMIDSQGMIQFNIYNILGQVVHQQRQYIPQGIQLFDMVLPEPMSSGIYFLQMIAGGHSYTRKFTVLK